MNATRDLAHYARWLLLFCLLASGVIYFVQIVFLYPIGLSLDKSALIGETHHVARFEWLLLSFFGGLSFYSFCCAAKVDRNYRCYIALGWACYFHAMGTIGALPAVADVLQSFQLMANLWLVGMVWVLMYFVGVWTGYWGSLSRQFRYGLMMVAALATLGLVVSGVSTGEVTRWSLAIYLSPFFALSLAWIVKYFYEAPRHRLALVFVLGCFWGELICLTYIAELSATERSLVSWHYIAIGAGLWSLLSAVLLYFGKVVEISRKSPSLIAHLKAQQAEIDRFRCSLERETKQRVLSEERGRIVRDVHDGIGGRLTSLLIRIRAGGLGREQIEKEIQDSISELRLTIDALDMAEDDFETALATLRTRIEDQLDAVDMVLKWRQDDLGNVRFDVGQILNISRFLQEAVVNAIRHAHASRISVQIRWGASRNEVQLVVADDGCGIDVETLMQKKGRGLKNLRHRASLLGGELVFSGGPNNAGLTLDLRIPIGRSIASPHVAD